MKIVASQVLHPIVRNSPCKLPNVITKYGHLNTPLVSDPPRTKQLAKQDVHYILPGKLAMGGAPPHYMRGLPLVSVNHTKIVNTNPMIRPSLYQTSTTLSRRSPLNNKPLKALVKSFE